MGSFKLGDNIVFNLAILKKLYAISEIDTQAKFYFRKLQIITIVSIIEAVLYDFHLRARTYTFEGVQNLTQGVLDTIRSKQIDKFEKLIASCKKHKIFDSYGEQFYSDLDNLRKLRNRVHIQNEKNDFEPDDSSAFLQSRLLNAEECLEKVCRLMLLNHPRSTNYEAVNEFEFPWNAHYPVPFE